MRKSMHASELQIKVECVKGEEKERQKERLGHFFLGGVLCRIAKAVHSALQLLGAQHLAGSLAQLWGRGEGRGSTKEKGEHRHTRNQRRGRTRRGRTKEKDVAKKRKRDEKE